MNKSNKIINDRINNFDKLISETIVSISLDLIVILYLFQIMESLIIYKLEILHKKFIIKVYEMKLFFIHNGNHFS